MYSSCYLIPLLLLSNLATIFLRIIIDKRKFYYRTWFCALSWARFLWKSQFGVRRCPTAYGMFYARKCSLVLSIPYLKNIQSPDRKIQTIGSWKVETTLLWSLRNILGTVSTLPNYPRLKWYRNLLTENEKVRGGAKKFTRVRQSYSCLSY